MENTVSQLDTKDCDIDLLLVLQQYKNPLRRFFLTPRIHQKIITARDQFNVNTTVYNLVELNRLGAEHGYPGVVMSVQVSMTNNPDAIIALDKKLRNERERVMRECPGLTLPHIRIVPLFEEIDVLQHIEEFLENLWEYVQGSCSLGQNTSQRFCEFIGEFFIADRYMYMPLAGILIILVFSLKTLIDKLPHRLTWMIIIPLLLTAVYAPATIFQIRTWQNSETLYAHALLVTKENFLAHHALGHVLASRKDKAGAINHFSKAAAIRPEKAVLWVTLGKALAFDHQWTKAAEAFERAARLNPEHPAVWFYLGCIRAVRGETPEALDFLLQSLEQARHEDRHIDAVHQQVMGLYEKGRYHAARDQFPLADQYYTQALSMINVSVSRRQLTRLIIDGYDQWLAEITTR